MAVTSSSPQRVFPTGRTILQVLAVARWGCWAWMVGVIAFSGDAVRHPVAAWLAVAVTFVVSAAATVAVRTRPERLVTAPRVLGDVVVAIGLTVLDGYVFAPGHVFVTSQNLAVEWTFIAVAAAGVAYGPSLAALAGLTFGPARWVGGILNGFNRFQPKHFVSMLATSLFYAACGAIFGWLTRMLRRAEAEISDTRAREEMARVMHDTVLQTLALVERRSRTSDPDLAALAREADRDVRRYLFGPTPTARGLAAAISAAVERARGDADVDVTVNVIDDGCRLEVRSIEAVARAIGQAVANAIEHADAGRIVVFAETDDDGHVFGSVRDDGQGFDVEAPRDGNGLDQSIIARIEAIGGRVVVSSSGAGTEVNLWSHA